MKILMLNKYFYLRGGSERYFFELMRLLQSHGHTVIPFSMHDRRNEPSEWSKYFVPNIEYNGPMSAMGKARAAFGTIYSPTARRNFEQLVRQTQPDIIHAHNIYHQLSYSPLTVAWKMRIPVVLTAHDYKLVCPNNMFYRHGEICQRCAGRHFHHAFTNRCGKGATGSFVLAAESYFNRRISDVVKRLDAIITPSRFIRDRFIQYGLPPQKVIHRHNMIDAAPIEPRHDGDGYVLYLGRLAREKGVATLVEAMAGLRDVNLKIAGEGPEQDALQGLARKLSLQRVEFMGYQSGQALVNLIRGASAIIVPSQWHENLPYSVLEAMAYGKPVIGARVGGIPELIEHGQTGFLFNAGDAGELAGMIRRLLDDPQMAQSMGQATRQRVEKYFSPQEHYEFLIGLYQRLSA